MDNVVARVGEGKRMVYGREMKKMMRYEK